MMHLAVRRFVQIVWVPAIFAGAGMALCLSGSVAGAAPSVSANAAKAAALGFRDYVHWPEDVDPAQFFPVSKVRPGMRGVGRTVFEGAKIEEFEFEVLGVAHNFYPESDLVWVRVETPRLQNIGVVAGMSGSPVYLDGKMLGAVAYGYSFTREPIAGITPIEEMIRVLDVTDDKPHPPRSGAVATTWAEARSVMERWKEERSFLLRPADARSLGLPGADSIPVEGAPIEPLGMTLQISSTNPIVLGQANRMLSSYGLRVVSGAGLSSGLPSVRRVEDANREIYPEKPQVADGAALGVTLMQGSLTLSGVGTITYVHGDRLVAFGHPMFGDGEVDYPMATAIIFGIMPSIMRPFKIGEAFEEVGSIRQDRIPAIGGQLGYVTPKLPMIVRVKAPDMQEDRVFSYEVVPDKSFAPYYAMMAWTESVASADRPGGPMTLESTIRVHLTRGRTLERTDFLSGESLPVAIAGYQLADYLGNLMNNPFETVKVDRIEIGATIRQRLDLGIVVDSRLDRDAYRPGETARLRFWLQRWHGDVTPIDMFIQIPPDLEDGEYELRLLDGSARESLEYQLHPEWQKPLNVDQLIDGLQVGYPSNQLYLVLTRSISGMTLSGQQLPELPGSVQSAMKLTAPRYQTLPLNTRLVREVRKSFPYEVGGTRSHTLRVDRRLAD